MKLHEDREVFIELIGRAADHFKIPQVYIEKDYWVTQGLLRLSESEYARDIVLKGGTSLSKAHRLINRFSEDIDLAAKCVEFTGNQTKALLRNVERAATIDFSRIDNQERESKGSTYRKTIHHYESVMQSENFGQVSDHIMLEVNAFTDPEPAKDVLIGSLIGEMLAQSEFAELVDQFMLGQFQIQVLGVEKTLAEKVMALVKLSRRNNPIGELRRHIRHVYDICMICRDESYLAFINSEDFLALIGVVREADRRSFRGAARWLDEPLGEALLFGQLETVWPQLRREFQGSFTDMIFDDDLPDDDEVKQVIGLIGKRLAE